MIVELTGEISSVTYKNCAWTVMIELKQEMPENGFRKLGEIMIRIDPEDVTEITASGCKFVKVLVESE